MLHECLYDLHSLSDINSSETDTTGFILPYVTRMHAITDSFHRNKILPIRHVNRSKHGTVTQKYGLHVMSCKCSTVLYLLIKYWVPEQTEFLRF